jgi:acyl-CoA synthetase (AMP-forming)/AMP-acid ligase II/acetyltransferase-like isoleucine patch superfamily enzyme/acyl carrier protein
VSDALTLYEVIRRHAMAGPEAVAISAPGRPPSTYGALCTHVEQTARTLRALGVKRSDRVAMVLPNGPEMAVGFVAVASAAACAPLNPAYRVNEFEYYLSDVNAKALLVWSDLASPARTAATTLKIPVIDVKPARRGDAVVFELVGDAETSAHDTTTVPAPGDTALVLHTSGTTSRPKIVPLTHANICTSGLNIARTLKLTAEDRCLNVMPLFHIHGLIAAVVASLTAGASVICTPGFDAGRFFGWLETFRPTWYTAVPTIHQAVLAAASAHADIVARCRLRFIRSSSASLPPAIMAQLEKVFGTQVIEAYGMTEAAHQMASNPLAPLPRKPGSVGVAAGPDVAIMDESGRLLPAGETGEVVVRGPSITAGYENNGSANDAAFVDRWFRTGDLGRLDDDGYLFLTGRRKEIINRGGEKISPREVDEVLVRHPAVAEAIAFAVPHPTLGEDIAAAVVLRPEASASPDHIREFAAARLTPFKVPQQVLCVAAIPKGPTGKPQRIGLYERLVDEPQAARQSRSVTPTSAVESQLVQIWKQVLGVDDVGVRDNFYALGGDSLTMARMVTQAEERFSRSIRIDHFLDRPTVETLAGMLGETGPRGPAATSGAPNRRALRDTVLKGLKDRILQYLALYAPGYKTTRVWLHRMRGVAIGPNVSIGLSTLIETAYPELVSIGKNVTIGMRVLVIAHFRDRTVASRMGHEPTVRIEDDAYIGPGVIILPNVTIGRGAVVSAGSVVSKSIPEETLARGNPAEPIARCGISLAGGVAYEEFIRALRPLPSRVVPGDEHPCRPESVGQS